MAGVSLNKKMPAPNSMLAGNTVVFKCPPGLRYHDFYLEYSGVTLAQMESIKIMLNGKPIHRYTATRRNKMNMHDRLANADDKKVLVLPLGRKNLKNRMAEEETHFNTGKNDPMRGGINTIEVHIQLAAGTYTPNLKLSARQSTNTTPDLGEWSGAILYCLDYPRNASSEGQFEYSDLPWGQVRSQALSRCFIEVSAGEITHFELERDTGVICERSAALNDSILKDGVRTPQAAMLAIDRTEMGYGGDGVALLGATDFRYRLTFTEKADTVLFQQETVGGVGD